MAQVDEDAELVHALDRLHAGQAQAGVRGLQAAVAEQVPAVVGRLHDADAEAVELLEAREIGLEGHAVLETVDQPGAARRLGSRDVGGLADAAEHVGMPVDLPLQRADPGHGLRECGIGRRGPDRQDRRVHAGDPGIAHILQVLVGQRPVAGRRTPEAAEPVDHDGVAVGAARGHGGTRQCERDGGGGAAGEQRAARQAGHLGPRPSATSRASPGDIQRFPARRLTGAGRGFAAGGGSTCRFISDSARSSSALEHTPSTSASSRPFGRT